MAALTLSQNEEHEVALLCGTRAGVSLGFAAREPNPPRTIFGLSDPGQGVRATCPVLLFACSTSFALRQQAATMVMPAQLQS